MVFSENFFVILETHKGNFVETFSAKITNEKKKRVSCHEYDYTRFVDVLDCKNTKLETYLKLFQEYGGVRKLEENLDESKSLDEFQQLLSPKKGILNEWALSGKHDFNNTFNETQISKNLIIKQDTLTCMTVEDYIKQAEIISHSNSSNLGTIFTWTYPSGGIGRKIQLKMPIFTQDM